jgi:hypothetical protein
MRKILAPLLALVLIGTATVACGATIVGAHGCVEWTKQPENGKWQWLLGYLSGMNVMHEFNDATPKDPLAALRSVDQLTQWLDSYCQKNPASRMDAAASELFIELMKQSRK